MDVSEKYLSEYMKQWDWNVKYLCTSLKVSYHDAEELLSNAIFKYQFRRQIHGIDYEFKSLNHLKAFISRIAKNLFIDKMRGKNYYIDNIDDHSDIHEYEVVSFDSKPFKQKIRNLPMKLREPVMMRAMGLKYKEISSVLNISEGTVKAHIHKGKKKLQNDSGADSHQ